jgi:hypothetical protein
VPGDPLLHGKVDGQAVAVQVDAVGSGWRLIHEGGQAEALVLTPRQAELYALMPVKARPTPRSSCCRRCRAAGLGRGERGQEVKAGEPLAVVEAMKMENVLRAAQDGTVKTLHAKAGDSLRSTRRSSSSPDPMALQARLTISGPGSGRRLSRLGDRHRAAARSHRLGAATAATARSRPCWSAKNRRSAG